MGDDFGVVAVGPYILETIEIGAVEALLVRVVPERHRAGGEGGAAHQFAFFADHRLAVVVKHRHVQAQAQALQFAPVHRHQRAAQREAGNNIGAAGNRAHQQVRFDLFVEEVVALVQQRRAGGVERAQGGQVVAVAGHGAGFFHRLHELGAGAEVGDLLRVDHIEQAGGVRVGRVAVVEHQGGAGLQAADQPVPHHPAAGGEVEQHVVGAQVAVQAVFLGVLDQGAAGAVHDTLGRAGGAGGIENIKRMVERQLGEGRRRPGGGQPVAPVERLAHRAGVAASGNHDQQFRLQFFMQRLDAFIQLDPLAVVLVAVAGEQHLGFDLAEAVQDTFDAEVRRAGRPDGADPGAAQSGDHGFDAVGHVASDPVAGLNAGGLELRGHLAGGHVQVVVADLVAAAAFVDAYQGGVGVVPGQQVLGHVDARVREPAVVAEHR